MQNDKGVEELDLSQGLDNYFSFIRSLTMFVIHFFQSASLNVAEEELLKAENEVTKSIVLIEKLHMFIYLNFSTLTSHLSTQKKTNPFDNHFHQVLFEKLQKIMKHYEFQNEENKNICEKTLSQIIIYYSDGNNIQFTLTPISPPWFSNLISERKDV